MALKVFLKHPWYDPEGYYRRVEDNPHIVEIDLADIPSTAEIEGEGGKRGERKKVWELRGEEDPATRAETARLDAESRTMLPLARALTDPKGTLKNADALEKENEDLRKRLDELQKKYEVPPAPQPDNSPPIQQSEGAGTNAVPGSNPITHGTQAAHPREGQQGTDADGKPTLDPDNTGLKPLPAETKPATKK
jgi:hypothetical protein